ncbi:MAG: hypothetical protein IPJ74_14685 [Saprospiraceae bacterium]|nr:hypothetical protein [Saprospiraceae bacterium]
MKRQIYLLFLLFCTIVSAQEYQFRVRQISIKDGLPNNYVRAVMQDRNGFIWMATNSITARFDGYQIKEIYEDEDLPPLTLSEDKHGKIWINHFNKALYANPKQILNIYDPSTDSITSFDKNYKNIAPFKTTDMVALFKGANKSIYIITKDYSLYKFDGVFSKLMDLPDWMFDIKHFYNYFNLVSQNDHFWIKTNQENYLWRVGTQGNIEKVIVPEVFDQMMLDEKNALWGLNFKSRRIYREIGNGRFETIKLDVNGHFNNNIITWSIDCKRQWIWCATQNYLNVFDFKGKLIGKYDINTNPKFKISYLTLMIDDNGNAWLGSSHGAFIISLTRNKFTNYLDDAIKDIRDILVDEDDKVFVAQDLSII